MSHRDAYVGARSICGGEQESDEEREATPEHALHIKKQKESRELQVTKISGLDALVPDARLVRTEEFCAFVLTLTCVPVKQ